MKTTLFITPLEMPDEWFIKPPVRINHPREIILLGEFGMNIKYEADSTAPSTSDFIQRCLNLGLVISYPDNVVGAPVFDGFRGLRNFKTQSVIEFLKEVGEIGRAHV